MNLDITLCTILHILILDVARKLVIKPKIYIFENKMLSKFVHNKSISKCIDSYRISDDVKNYLKGLRVK